MIPSYYLLSASLRRQADAGDQSAAFARQQLETAAVMARDAIDDRQTQSAPLAAARFFQARKRLLQPLRLLRRDSRATIQHFDYHLAALASDSYAHVLLHDHTITVTACGRICLQGKKINLSQVFAGQRVGVKEEDDKIWLVSFMYYDIGYFDLETCRVEPLGNPFGPKVLTMSPV